MQEVGTDDFVRFLELFARRIAERKVELTDLDSAIGDADHGINMDRGFSAVTAKLPDLRESDLGAIGKAVGMTLISTVGGASGPLYGTFFLRLGSSFGERRTVTGAELASALRAGLDGVKQRGRAELDDKTMVDAHDSRGRDARRRGPRRSYRIAALQRSAAAGRGQGRDRATIPLVARKGRASYLGERSAGHQDPGAHINHHPLARPFADTVADRTRRRTIRSWRKNTWQTT